MVLTHFYPFLFLFFSSYFTCTLLPSNQSQSITHPTHQCISVGSCSLPSCQPQNHRDLYFVSDLFSSFYFQVYKNFILMLLFWTYSILSAFSLWLQFCVLVLLFSVVVGEDEVAVADGSHMVVCIVDVEEDGVAV